MSSNLVWIEGTGKQARIRSPWLVLLLWICTLGLYGIFWWYTVNRELADLGRARSTSDLGTSPGTSTLAFTLGGLVIIPLIATIIETNRRIRIAQEISGGRTHNGWLAALLWVLTLGIGDSVYMQSELNRVWRAPGMRPVASDAAGSAEANADVERFQKLEQLRAAGCLSREEVEAQRARLSVESLAGSHGPTRKRSTFTDWRRTRITR